MIEDLVNEVKKRSAERVFLQLPDGLMNRSTDFITALKKENIECIVSADHCYGACDLRDDDAKQLDCDLLIHVGHSKFYRNIDTSVPVLYYPWTINVDISGIDFSVIKEKCIGLVTTIQHMHALDDVKKELESRNKTAVIGGQVLGCWAGNAEKIADSVDAFLFVGSGSFHAHALKGKIYILNLEKKAIERFDAMKYEKIRFARISNAKSAKTFAILVSTKKGQFCLLGKPEEIKKLIESKNRNAFIVVMDEINDTKLMGLKADVFINTACARLADDVFSKPFINADDIDKIFE